MPRIGSKGTLWNRDGNFYGIWYRHGSRFCENLHTGDEVEARSRLDEKMAECEASNQVRPEKAPPGIAAMLSDVIRYYERNGRKSTEHVERHVRRLKKAFGGKRADELTKDRIERYVEKRQEEEAANATINRELAVLRLSYSLARKAGKVKPDMVPAIEMLPENNRRKGFFEQEQYEAVLAKLPDHLKGAFTLAYWTGMRKEEVFGLTWDRIDLFNRLLFLDETKTEDRTLPMNDELSEVFSREWANKDKDCPHVFHNGPTRITDFRKAWKTACRKAGVPAKLFHDLRRTGVRNLIRAGVPQSVAMSISGHKDARIFARYDIVDTRDRAEAMRKVAEYEERKRQARAANQVLGSHTFTEAENDQVQPKASVTIH